MLILRRKEGQWVEITHRSGDVIRVRVCNIRSHYPGQLDLALDDPDRNFVIQRPERLPRAAAGPADAPPASFAPQDLPSDGLSQPAAHTTPAAGVY